MFVTYRSPRSLSHGCTDIFLFYRGAETGLKIPNDRNSWAPLGITQDDIRESSAGWTCRVEVTPAVLEALSRLGRIYREGQPEEVTVTRTWIRERTIAELRRQYRAIKYREVDYANAREAGVDHYGAGQIAVDRTISLLSRDNPGEYTPDEFDAA